MKTGVVNVQLDYEQRKTQFDDNGEVIDSPSDVSDPERMEDVSVTVKWMSKLDVVYQNIIKEVRDHVPFFIFILFGIGVIPLTGYWMEIRHGNENFERSGGAMVIWAMMWAPLTIHLLNQKIETSNRRSDIFGSNPKPSPTERTGEYHFNSLAVDATELRDKWVGGEILILLFGSIIWTFAGSIYS